MTAEQSPSSFSSDWAAEQLGAQVDGPYVDGLTGLKGLDEATSTDVSFLANPKYESLTRSTDARVLIAASRPSGYTGTVLLTPMPYLAMAKLAKTLLTPPRQPTISALASIDPSATIGRNVHIEALVFVGPGVVIGDGSTLHGQSYVGANATLGDNCELFPGAKVLERCQLGNRVTLQAGAVIGSDGFGYAPDDTGAVSYTHLTLPTILRV